MISYWGVDHGAEITKSWAKERAGLHGAVLAGSLAGGALAGAGVHAVSRHTDPHFQAKVSGKDRKKYIGTLAGVGGVSGLITGGPAGALGGAAGASGAAAFATRKRRRRAVQE
jgi:hypothetical protein